MKKDIEAYSAKVGHNRFLTQGAGGNISWKDDTTLHIKASGTWLRDALDQSIFVSVPLETAIAAADPSCDISWPKTNSPLRPSIETALHAVMPHKIVVHLHVVEALAYLVQTNGKQQLTKLLGPQGSWAWTDYHKPGPHLAQAVQQALTTYPEADLIFLGNHGIILGSESVEDIESQLNNLLSILYIEPRPYSANIAPIQSIEAPKGYQFQKAAIFHSLALDTTSFTLLSQNWRLYPDHIMFLGFAPQVFDSVTEFKGHNESPDYAIIKNMGVFTKTDISDNKLAMLTCFTDVLSKLSANAQLNSLTDAQAYELLGWEAETYRMAMEK